MSLSIAKGVSGSRKSVDRCVAEAAKPGSITWGVCNRDTVDVSVAFLSPLAKLNIKIEAADQALWAGTTCFYTLVLAIKHLKYLQMMKINAVGDVPVTLLQAIAQHCPDLRSSLVAGELFTPCKYSARSALVSGVPYSRLRKAPQCWRVYAYK